MRPISLLHHDLPAHLHLIEDPDLLLLRCARCGWTAAFSAHGATVDELHRAAQEHHCPPVPQS